MQNGLGIEERVTDSTKQYDITVLKGHVFSAVHQKNNGVYVYKGELIIQQHEQFYNTLEEIFGEPDCSLFNLKLGMNLTSIPTLLSSRILELVDIKLHAKYWGITTLGCAISQAIAAYFMSFILHIGISYNSCFMVAGFIFLISFIIIFFARASRLDQISLSS